MFMLFLCVSCSTVIQTAQPAAPAAAKKTPAQKANDNRVAVLNGADITRSELEEFLGPALGQIRQQEYQILSSGLKDYIFLKLQEKEAAALNISVEEYYKQNVTDKAGKPTEEEISQTLNQYRSRLPQDEKEARQKVMEFLDGQKIQQQEEIFKNELLSKAKYKTFIQPPRLDVKITENDPKKGPADAPIVLVEYSDFECPYCGRVQSTLEQVAKDYDGKILHVFKNLPLEFHKSARFAAEAALCAKDQGKFWEFHDWMYQNRSKLNSDGVKEYAGSLGMDVDAFTKCMDEHKYAAQIDADVVQAQILGATATPSFFINGRLLRGAQPLEQFKEIIDQELEFAAQKAN